MNKLRTLAQTVTAVEDCRSKAIKRWFNLLLVMVCVLSVLSWQTPFFQPHAAKASTTTTIGVISDYGNCSANEQKVANMVNGWNAAAIVTAGDNYQGGGCTPPYRGVYDYYPNYVTAPQAFWPVPGNHDYNDAPLSAYQSYFTWIPTVPDSGRRYYSKVLGDVEFFMVDSPGIVHDGGGIKDQTYFNVERNWLQSNMSMSKENGHQWQIVVLHYPPYTSATTHPSNTSLQWDYAAWGAEAVISGHDHVYERVMHDNIPYLTVGLGGQSRYSFGTPIPGSAVRYNSDYGALKLTATDTTLDFQFYSVSDGVVDNYQVQTLPVNPPNYRIFLPLAEMH